VHNMLLNQMVQVGMVRTGPTYTGPTYLQVDVSPPDAVIRVAWFDENATVEGRSEASVYATPDATGRARLFMDTTGNNSSPFVIYRDESDGFGPVTVTIKADTAPAELATTFVAGSFGPVVPRDVAAPLLNIGDPIVAPSELFAAPSPTNVYVQLENTGPRNSSQYDVSWLLDGVAIATFDFGIANANSGLIGTVAGAFYMTGGRHTQGMFIDSGNTNIELDETNNRWAAQWVWAPPTLGLDAPVLRAAPPVWNGGTSDIPAGVAIYPNADGYRTPVLGAGAQYAAVAMIPLGSSDHDLALHEVSTGPQAGFTTSLATSQWGPGSSDYVLINFGKTSPRAFDAGISGRSGTDGYRAQVTQSVDLGSAPFISHEAAITSTAIMHLYEVHLPAEPIEVHLENMTGTDRKSVV